mmetsp:Transcript_1389/g.3081  ORF Transcript_1389/g.3081 Transcript_1389/m.3081 type:complete len:357 (+) Transcript_1389:454-1524(+)
MVGAKLAEGSALGDEDGAKDGARVNVGVADGASDAVTEGSALGAALGDRLTTLASDLRAKHGVPSEPLLPLPFPLEPQSVAPSTAETAAVKNHSGQLQILNPVVSNMTTSVSPGARTIPSRSIRPVSSLHMSAGRPGSATGMKRSPSSPRIIDPSEVHSVALLPFPFPSFLPFPVPSFLPLPFLAVGAIDMDGAGDGADDSEGAAELVFSMVIVYVISTKQTSSFSILQSIVTPSTVASHASMISRASHSPMGASVPFFPLPSIRRRLPPLLPRTARMFLLLPPPEDAPATSRLNIFIKSRRAWLSISSNFESPLPVTSNPFALYTIAMSDKALVDKDNNVILFSLIVCLFTSISC